MSELAQTCALREMVGVGEGDGVHVRLWRGVSVISVLARKGSDIPSRLGIFDGPRQSLQEGVVALGVGPGRWLFLGRDMENLRSQLQGFASCSDQSDAYAVFEVWGECVRQALAKGVPVDLHPSKFSDDVAVTVSAHIGGVLWQSGHNRFAVAVFRSYAASFWHWLKSSSAEFGLIVEAS